MRGLSWASWPAHASRPPNRALSALAFCPSPRSLEICTFLLPHYFLPIGAVANAIKGLSWMAGGSTKSVFKVRPGRRCWVGLSLCWWRAALQAVGPDGGARCPA